MIFKQVWTTRNCLQLQYDWKQYFYVKKKQHNILQKHVQVQKWEANKLGFSAPFQEKCNAPKGCETGEVKKEK